MKTGANRGNARINMVRKALNRSPMQKRFRKMSATKNDKRAVRSAESSKPDSAEASAPTMRDKQKVQIITQFPSDNTKPVRTKTTVRVVDPDHTLRWHRS
jgi:hypothetical protein